MDMRFIGSGFLIDIPLVYPKTGRDEGALLTLDVFGIGRESEKLCLPCGKGTRLVSSRERNGCLGHLHLDRRRRAAQHGWRDKGVDNRDMGDVGEVLMQQQ